MTIKFCENLDWAKRLARAGRIRDGFLWLLLTSVGQQIRLRVKPDRHEIFIRTGSPDVQVALSCFGGEFDELLSAVPRPRHPLIIDAGGYIGTAAIVFAEAYPDATVVSIEPSKENFELLKRNVVHYKNIVPVNKALAPEPGKLTLKDRGTGQWGFTTVSKPDDNAASIATEEVECTTLAQLMQEFGADGIGILKLDIEGGEHALLSRNTDWIARTDAICIELHDRIVAGCSTLYREATAGRRNFKMEGEKHISIACECLSSTEPRQSAAVVNRPKTQGASRSFAARARRKLRAIRARVRTRVQDSIFPLRVQWLSGPRRVSASVEEVVVVCLVRNGAIFLPEFLRHYRELGAKHIVLLDNGSTDGTPALVASEPDVTVLRTAAPYKFYKDVMKRWLVTRFGRRNWVLCVDIDELFDYPFRRQVSTADLLRYLNRRGFTAMVAQMLDLFSQAAITEISGDAWRDEHRFYSLSDLEREPYGAFYGKSNEAPPVALDVMYGGIRFSAFQVRAMLTKHPLLFPSQGIKYVQAHHVSGARVADVSAVLLHYKFVGDFAAYARAIVKAESFWRNSSEYKQYLRAIEVNSGLSLYSETASEFSTVEQLVEQGFLVASDTFRGEVAKHAGQDLRGR
jgi:FkbM family methyltransferase